MSSNHKRQRIAPPPRAGAAVGINDVPEPILALIAPYLEKPVRPLLAVALTAPSSSWADCNWKKGPSSMGRAVLSNDLWEELDFSLMPRDVASRVTDADLGGALACIDAANKLRRLYLSQCINVTGAGLELLRGSAVLEELDLRTGIRMDDEDAVVVHRISPAVVVPILESILTKDGSSLEKVILNKSWRDDKSEELKEFSGRLFITCIEAKNVRGRANDARGDLKAPFLLFRLSGAERASNAGTTSGHDTSFNDEVLSFDLEEPENFDLIAELRDEGLNESVGRATYNVREVLASCQQERTEELQILRPGDSTTNSVARLKFGFVQAKHGVIKLRLDSLESICGKGGYAVVSTPDGQSKRVGAADANNEALGFWLSELNWFGDFAFRVLDGNGGIVGEATLSLLQCLEGSESDIAVTQVPIKGQGQALVNTATVNHWFLEAGFVQVQSLSTTNLRNVSVDSSGLANPRVTLRLCGKTHATAVTTGAATNVGLNQFRWSDTLRLPVVDECTLTLEAGEQDEVSGDIETIASAKVSLIPLFETGQLTASVDLVHANELGETMGSGKAHFAMTFEAPKGAAFPRDQPTMTSYVLEQSDEVALPTNNVSMDTDGGDEPFTEEAVQRAFVLCDLDNNGYIGVSELKHILIMMGEHVTDEEIDMMISMLDLNGDGQVSFKEFRAMAQSPDPANEDFLKGGLPERSRESIALQQKNEDAEKKREALSRCVQTCKLSKEDLYGIWKMSRSRCSGALTNESFRVGYEGVRDLLPSAFCSTSECRAIFDLLKTESDGEQWIDSRDLIMAFSSFVADFGLEEKCQLAFAMFDIDRSGFLSVDEIESMMCSTNLATRDLIKKRAENFWLCADTDRSGGITLSELIAAAEKLPNLLYPSQTRK
ncbi:hypothetical protein ACHAXT_011941 [Thalassiosira profunda]